MTFSEFTWGNSGCRAQIIGLYISESWQQEQPCNVCVAISEVRQTTNANQGSWLLGPSSSQRGRSEGGPSVQCWVWYQFYGHSPSPYPTPRLHRKSQICLGTGSSTAALAELPAQTQHSSREEAWVPLLGIALDTCRSPISELEY